MVRRMQESNDNIFYCAECTYDKSNGTMFLYTTDITEVRGSTKPKDSMNVEGGFLVRRKYFRSEYEAQKYIDSLPNAMPMSRNESFRMRKFNRLNESFDDIDGYAVDIRDMSKGYHHLLLFDDIADAEYAYDRLDDISESDMDDEDIAIAVDAVVDTCNEVVNEIDWRREIDKNNVWTAGDDTRYQIVGKVDLWLYW